MADERFHKIKSLSVEGGFLDGLSVEFDSALNCVIGGRGTGKTTVVEFIRYALMIMPDKKRASALHKSIESLVLGNLGTGRITLEIEAKDGLVYRVERVANKAAALFDAAGEDVGLSLETSAIFKAEVYSQNQIEDIANSPFFQLELLDKFAREEINRVEGELRTVERDLALNGADMARLKGEMVELAEGTGELKLVGAKLEKLKVDAGEANELEGAIARRGLREKESRTLANVEAFATKMPSTFIEIKRRTCEQLDALVPSEVKGGPNFDVFKDMSGALLGWQADMESALDSVAAGLGDCVRAVTDAKAKLAPLHAAQEEGFQKLMAKYEEQRGKAKERTALQQRQMELLEQKQALGERQKELQKLQQARDSLIDTLSELRDKRYAVRARIAEDLNAKLAPEIRISMHQAGDVSGYEAKLIEALKGARRQYRRTAEKVARTIPPRDFARMIQTGSEKELVERLDCDPERARWLIGQFSDLAQVLEIEVVDLNDEPTIELKDGAEYKDSTALSTGQKCTTILPILLLESENPLLIDQPEDNLDNRFIYETVVRSICEARGKRQLLFVTHNPNIPVLGEAGRVFVMSSTGRKASVEDSGSVDDVKGHIELILEGGKEAFRLRKEKYGY